jgi:integrase
MKVNLLERVPGQWRLRIETKDEFGKRQFKYETVHGTRAVAEARKNDLMQGKALPRPKLNAQRFAPAFKQWVEGRRDFGFIRPSTAANYLQNATPMLKVIGHMPVPEIGRAQVDALYRQLVKDVGPQRTQMLAVLLRHFCKDAVAAEDMTINPTEGVTVPKAPKRVKKKTLAPEQLQTVIEASRSWGVEGVMVRFAIATGCRRGEICALKPSDFDFATSTVKIERTVSVVYNQPTVEAPKTESGNRKVTLPSAMAAEMKAFMPTGEWVFPSNGGTLRDPNKLTMFIARKLHNLGLGDFTLHDLRHAHATLLLSQRMPIKAVSQRLGHSDVRITLGIYAHVLPGDDETLAQAVNSVF